MNSLTQLQLQALTLLQKKIQLLQRALELVYEETLLASGIEDNDWVFDYVHNVTDNDAYSKFILSKLTDGDNQ